MNNEDIHNYLLNFFPKNIQDNIKKITDIYNYFSELKELNNDKVEKLSFEYQDGNLFISTKYIGYLYIHIECYNKSSNNLGIQINSTKTVFFNKNKYQTTIVKLKDDIDTGIFMVNSLNEIYNSIGFISSESIFFIFDNIDKKLDNKSIKDLLLLTHDIKINNIYFDLLYESLKNPRNKIEKNKIGQSK